MYNMDNTVGSLTQYQRSIIIGSLLGDGYARTIPGRKNAFLEINHSITQKKYVDWKYSVLKSISGSPPKARKGNGKRIAYRFYTRQHPELTQLAHLFYKDGKKVIPRILIDSVSLAIWYMDDGSKCRDSDIYLNTQQFTFNDQQYLLEILASFGIHARLNKDKNYFRIRLLKESIPKLKDLISDHVIDDMRYKLVS